jgi:hypothetical protein
MLLLEQTENRSLKAEAQKRKPGWLARFLMRRVGCGYIAARRDWR